MGKIKTVILGLDPGRKGALCVREDDERIEFYSLPFIESDLDMLELSRILKLLKDRYQAEGYRFRAYLEKAQSMPKNGGAQMFQYGRSFGALEAILFMVGIRYELVHPKTWTKEVHRGMDKSMDSKNKSHLVAKRLYPHLNLKRTEKCKKDDEGFIDSLLIAEFGARIEHAIQT